MYLVLRQNEVRIQQMLCRYKSSLKKSHYEILNLPRNCSDKDIKEAFIQLSKEYHPDKNKNDNAHAQFVQVVEAYNVLGKPSSRARYDNTVEIDINSYGRTPVYQYPGPFRPMKERTFYEDRDKSQDAYYASKPYYGFRGYKKVPNFTVVLLCIAVTLIGVTLQLVVIRQSFRVSRQQSMQKSQKNALDLDIVKANALENGNEAQTQMLLKKITAAANQNIATATLAQSLASEKPK